MVKCRRYIAIYIFWVAVSVIIAGLLRSAGIEDGLYSIESSCVDGMFVWSADKLLIIGLIPMVIIAFNLILKKYENNSYIIFRYDSRIKIWIRQEIRLLLACMAAMFMLMFFCGVFALLISGGKLLIPVEEVLESLDSTYLGYTFKGYNIDTNININYIYMALQCFIINSLEIFLIVLISNVLEWISNSVMFTTLLSFGFCIIVGVNPQAGYAYKFKFLNIKVFPGEFYNELLNQELYFQRLLMLLIIIFIINLLIVPIVRKRDFISRGDLY